MPCLKIFTTLAKESIPDNFVQKILPVLSKAVRKPPEKFMVVVSPECQMTLGGGPSTPGVVATLESIGNLGVEENKVIAKEVTTFLHQELGVAPENVFLTFYDLRGQDIAKGGDTFSHVK